MDRLCRISRHITCGTQIIMAEYQTSVQQLTALAEVYESCIEAIEEKEMVGMVLLDQSAAFDLLSHDVLEEKLKLYNFEATSIEWIMSYLKGRSQSIQVEARRSSPILCADQQSSQTNFKLG